jgi:hypothetical protein
MEASIAHATLSLITKAIMLPIDIALLRLVIWSGVCEICDLPRPSLRQTVGVVALAFVIT